MHYHLCMLLLSEYSFQLILSSKMHNHLFLLPCLASLYFLIHSMHKMHVPLCFPNFLVMLYLINYNILQMLYFLFLLLLLEYLFLLFHYILKMHPHLYFPNFLVILCWLIYYIHEMIHYRYLLLLAE